MRSLWKLPPWAVWDGAGTGPRRTSRAPRATLCRAAHRRALILVLGLVLVGAQGLAWAGDFNLKTSFENYWFQSTSGPAGPFTNYFATGAGTLAYGGHVLGNTNNHRPTGGGFGLDWSSFGQPVRTLQAEIALGEPILPPDDANTNLPPANFVAVQVGDCTNAYYQSTNDGTFWVPSTRQIIAAQANNVRIDWVTTNGSTRTQIVTVDAVPMTRPARIFWTESPYDAPGVSLSGLFPVIHYNAEVPPPLYEYVTNTSGSYTTITTNILAGVWLDDQKQLHAKNVSGTFLIEYYQEGTYRRQVQPRGIEVVQVVEPFVQLVQAEVGTRLMPTETYWAQMDSVNGVIPNVTEGLNETVYVHAKGRKANWAFAIKRTSLEPWSLEIYWQHRGIMGVLWPYEVDRYSCTWPAYPQLLVLGDSPADQPPTLIPAELGAELQADMDPLFHAQISPSGRVLNTTEPGICLVKYSAYDDVWFEVIKTVSHTNFFYFDREPREWPIGQELTPGDDQAWAMGFDGAADYVSIGESYLNRRTNWSVSLWFKVADFRAATLYSEGNPRAAFELNITTNGQLAVATWNKTLTGTGWRTNITVGAPLKIGHWHYLTVTYAGGSDTGGTVRFYLDDYTWTGSGIPRVNFDGERFAAFGALTAQPPLTNYFLGKIDSLRIWTTALTWDEVHGNPYTIAPETKGSLVADFRFDEGQGQVVHNAAGDQQATACAGAFWCYGQVVPGGQWSGFPGYIHSIPGDHNTDRYNVGRYSYPTELNPGADSHVFAVNTGSMEVWWAHRSRQPGMPAVYYPSQAVCYTNEWPSLPPQIVMASGKGSSGDSLLESGSALHFNGTEADYVTASPEMGITNELTVEAWVKLSNPGASQKIVSWMNRIGSYYSGFLLGVYQGAVDVEYWTGSGWTLAFYNHGVVPSNTWTHIAYSFKAGTSNSVVVYVDGQAVWTTNYVGYGAIRYSTSDLYIGRASWTLAHFTLGDIGEVRVWRVARSPQEIAATWHTRLAGTEPGLVVYYPFERAEDPSVLSDFGPSGAHGTIRGATWTDQGRVARSSPLVMGSPSIYYQNDPDQPGYNPNEEHALILGGVAYALRNDLNRGSTSEPYVLVDYLEPGTAHPKMLVCSVQETNEFYSFNYPLKAGLPIVPPMPLGAMPLCTNNDSCTEPPAWKDRKNSWWAVSAGDDGGTAIARMHFYYTMQPGFFFPEEGDRKRYPVGAEVPWLPRASDHGGADAPVPILYTITWPDAPVLHLGQTLTKATKGLPEVWGQLSVDIVYQQSQVQDQDKRDSAILFDPVVARGVDLDKATVDALISSRLARQETTSPLVRFPNLSPSLYSRIYWDPNRGTNSPLTKGQLVLSGVYEQTLTGQGYLLLNMLEDFEQSRVKDLVPGDSPEKAVWNKTVELLPQAITNLVTDQPYVHAALGALLSEGSGYVTLAFNDSRNAKQVPPALPVSLAILRVDTNLYSGEIEVLQPADVLGESLSLRYSADFAGNADNCEFRWRWEEPVGGLVPNTDYDGWHFYGVEAAVGTNEVTIAGSSPFTLSDHYFAVQYRPTNHFGPSGESWSLWTHNFAPGWVKRVMSGVNPFFQRLPDMTANPVDTKVTMISQAGGPYVGDVALNMDAVSQAGLIPIYETVFNRAKDFSIRAGLSDRSMNETLLYAATRLRDLYMLLGNEAYADALDPTIAFPQALSSDTHGGSATSIFPFMNQEPNLLEEELALLRGRDDTLNPPIDTSPVYNRLIWNFTAGINGGEPAYAYNYNIRGDPSNTVGTITAQDAQRLYPQGHGDAWGHYLSAINHYYDLLAYTNFYWQTEPTATLLGNAAVSVDFFDEQKFAETAAARARTGVLIVKDTFRERYSEDATGRWPLYTDSDTNRAWGIDGWASRAGQAAYYDWVVANSLLLDSLTNLTQVGGTNLPPEGIQKIDRASTPELAEITASLRDIQTAVDSADAGLNPLGLSRNVVSFDIDPTAIDAGKTHFEQVYDRAIQAVYNACVAFDQARGATLQLRDQFDSAADLAQALAKSETDYKNQLIAIYGYPFADDLGPNGTYPQDYDGPDLINWQILDLGDPPLANAPTGQVKQVTMYTIGFNPKLDWSGDDPAQFDYLTNSHIQYGYTDQVSVCTADNGLKLKPATWTGHRRAQGELQLALSDFVQSWYALEAAGAQYAQNQYALEVEVEHRQADYSRFVSEWAERDKYLARKQTTTTTIAGLKVTKELTGTVADAIKEYAMYKSGQMPNTISGLLGPFPTKEFERSIGAGLWDAVCVSMELKSIAASLITMGIEGANMAQAAYDHEWEALLQGNTYKSQLRWPTMDTLVKLQGQEVQQAELLARIQALDQAQQRIAKLVAEGERLVFERAQVRARAAQRIQTARYGDLAFRTYRDDALRRYQQTFDLAARYTYLAAKAYDYETGLLRSDTARTPGSKFLEDVVRSRAPGRFYVWLGTPMSGGSLGEPGLADVLARMKADWDVVKGRFGFNNPQTETSRFSLRSELFRISPGAEGDPFWRQALEDCKVANLYECSEFLRYCRPYNDSTNVEPALVIPFSTFVIAGQNYFGHDLAGGDNAYDASHAATKVRSMGVWFTNYNITYNTNAVGPGLANEPRVYLIPVGEDVMRSPTRNAVQLRHWQVLDQAIPLPYNIGGAQIDNPDWLPVVDSLREPLAQIRRFASFRAYHDAGAFDPGETCTNGRLVGRSVWNTRWLLIIPGRTLLSDPNEGIERFIRGSLISPTERDNNGVKDIKIFFQTYSIPGD